MAARKQRDMLASILILVGISLVTLAVISGVTSYRAVYHENINSMRQQNRALVNRLEGWIALKGSLVENNAMLLRDSNVRRETALEYFIRQTDSMDDVSAVYAGFPDGSLVFGAEWDIPEGWYFSERPWYMTAASNPGQVVFTRPYMDANLNDLAFSGVRTISDFGTELGVAALDIPLNTMAELIASDNEYTHSFSFILDYNGDILFHPDTAYVPLDDFTFQNIGEVAEGIYTNMFESIVNSGFYRGRSVTYVGTALDFTGWYIITSVPASYIMGNVYTTLLSVIATAVFSLLALFGTGIMLRKVSKILHSEREANEMNEALLAASPFAIDMWDENFNFLDCNRQTLDFFGVSSKEEYIECFCELFPKYQPGGALSEEKVLGHMKAAMENGSERFEYMLQSLDGEQLPAEVILARIKRRGKYVLVGHIVDLRMVKAVMKKENEATELSQLFMDLAPFCIELWDEDGKLIYCNQKMIDVSNLTTFEDYKSRLHEMVLPRQPDGTPSELKMAYIMDKAMREGFVRTEWTKATIDGEPVHFETQFFRITRYGKKMLLAYSHDLREVRSAVAKTREADERAMLMLDATPLSCFMARRVVSKDGVVGLEAIDCNKAAIDLFGFSSKEEAIARFFEIFHGPEEEFSFNDVLDDDGAAALESGYHCLEFTHRNLEGELIPCEVTLIKVNYQGESIIIGFQDDLREIQAAREKEREAHEWTRKLVDAAPFFVEIWNDRYNLIECNMPVAKLFNLPGKEEFIRRYYELSPEYQPCGTPSKYKIRELLDKAFKVGTVRSEWMHIGPDGEPLPFDVSYVHLKRGDDDVIVSYNHDLRPIKAIMAKEREAEEESRAKSRFLARMSHEVRTPMNAVLGITEIQLRKGGHSLETEEAFLRIYNSSRLLLTIINDILDLSKVEAGKMEIVPSAYEMASLIADTVQLNLMYIGSKRIEFTLGIDEKMPAYLIGDELRIKQILNNILSNAFKYTNEGEVSLVFKAEHGPQIDDVTLIFMVSDTGQGMTKEQVGQVFGAEFTRFNLESNRVIEGSGLGMSIAHSLVKMMDGDIKAESEEGKGSVFTVRIPQKLESGDILGKEAAQRLESLEASQLYLKKTAKAHIEPMPYGSVLVVDDVESNLYVVKGMLMPYKIAIETADSGTEAIAKVAEGKVYDIIFMDHMMPGMDGIEAVKIIRDMGYRYPIVALTANATIGASQIFLNNGFQDFISKPTDPDNLNKCLINYIYNKQPEEVIKAANLCYPSQDSSASKVLNDRLVESFLIDAKKSIVVLEPIVQKPELDLSELKTYTIQTHAIKSALSNIGRTELSQIASVLEQAGRDGDKQAIKRDTEKFLEKVKEVVKELSAKKDKFSVSYDDDPVFLRERLYAISEACANYDKKTVEKLLAEFKEKSFSVGTKAVLNKLPNLLLLSDFEEAAALAKQTADALQTGAKE